MYGIDFQVGRKADCLDKTFELQVEVSWDSAHSHVDSIAENTLSSLAHC